MSSRATGLKLWLRKGRKQPPRLWNRGLTQTRRIKLTCTLEPPEAVPDGEIAAAIQRGVDFLLKDQNGDGSWGSPHRTKDLNILAGIGSHHAFRTAVTSLCVAP